MGALAQADFERICRELEANVPPRALPSTFYYH
jgi:hypothetical protein